jgi:hypothetical protein
MTNEKTRTSWTRRVFSVILLTVGTAAILGQWLPTYARSRLGLPPEYGLVIGGSVIGAGLIWGGAALWNRWRMTLGVVCLVFSLLPVGNIPILKSKAQQANGMESAWLLALADAALGIAVIGVVIGILLIVWARQRAKDVHETSQVA